MSERRKSVREALPERLSLTEAVTYIVTGRRLTDQDVANIDDEQKQVWKRDWGSINGPHWLFEPLRLLAGEVVVGASTSGVEDPNIEAARRWLLETRRDAATALEQVKAELHEMDLENALYDRCYSLLWALHEKNRDVVWVRQRYPGGRTNSGHKPLPLGSIQRGENPLWHLRGEGLYGWGALVMSDQAGLDGCPIYLEPFLNQANVLELKRRFERERPRAQAKKPKGVRRRARDQDLRERLRGVLSYARDQIGWANPRTRPSGRAMARHIMEQRKDEGFAEDSVRQILAGSYRPMNRLSLKGLDG